MLPTERGRIVVNPDLSVQRTPRVWAIGDCALVINDRDRMPAQPTAQFAVREAQCLAGNLLATLAGQPTRAFSYRSRGAYGGDRPRKGVADIFWYSAVRAARMAAVARLLPGADAHVRPQARIFVEWTWGMFFPNDITHLRFNRSHELDGDPAHRGAARAAQPARMPTAIV